MKNKKFISSYYSSYEDQKEDYDEEIKVIVLGESGVGKSNIIIRYSGGEFNSNSLPNNSSSFVYKYYTFGNKVYRINVWDTAGQEKYRSLTKIFTKNSNIALLVYAIDDYNSFEKLDFWYNSLKDVCKDVIISVVGNKIDLILEEKVDQKEAKAKAKEFNAEFGLTSALNEDTGIDELIEKLIKKYIESIGGSTKTEAIKSINNIKLEEDTKEMSTASKKLNGHKSKCC